MTTDSAFAVLAGLRNEDDRPWGAAADDVQVADARAILDGDGPRRHWIGRPRGYSKTHDVAGMLLADLITGKIPPSNPGYLAAADRGQAGLALDSIEGFVNRSSLTALIDVQSLRAVHKGSGASIEVLPADAAGSYGLRPSRICFDELAQWPDTRQSRKFYEALVTALPKVPGSVGVVITTAGSPGHFSHAVYQRALKESQLWRVSMVHTSAPWIDPKLIEAEKRSLTDSAFRRLWQNYFTQPEDALVSASDLEAAAVLDGPVPPAPGIRYVITLDVGLVNDRTVLAVCHREGVGEAERVILDRIWRWQGTRRSPVDLREVEETIVEAHNRYPGEVVADPFQAVGLLQSLTKRGIGASKFDFTSQSVGRLAGSLLRSLRSRRLSLPNDPVLLDELAGVRIVENSAGVPRLEHNAGAHDDQAVAISLAVHRLTDGHKQPPQIVFADPSTGFAPDGSLLQVPVGPGGKFAMDPADAFYLDRLGDGSW
jgi:hypothetical protein